MMKKRRDTETQGGGLPLFHRPSSLRPCVSAFFLLFLLSAHGAPTADRLFKQKKWREAETAYVTIATKSPLSKEGVKARYRIGVCRLKRKDQAGALRAFLRLAEDRDAARAAPETVLFAYREVWALLAIPSEDNRRMQLVRRCAAAFPSNEVSAAICAEEGLLQARRARFSDADAFFRLGGTRLSVPTPGWAESPPPISVGAAVHRVIRKGILSRSNEPFTSFLPGVEAVEKSGDWMCAAANAPLAEKCRLAKAETLLEDLDDAKGAAALYEKVTVTRENAATVIPGLVLARLAAGNTKGAETLLADAGKASLLTEPLHSRLRDALAGTFGDSRFNGSLASETPQAKAAFRTAEVLAKGGRHLRAANAYGRLEHSVKNTELAAYANLLRAECLANAGRAGKALPLLDTFKTRYRKTKRAGEGLLLAGCLSAGALRNTRQAGRYFRLSADIRTDKESAQRALFYLATLSQWGKRRREALGLYAELLKKYPDTPFKDEIQKHRIPALRKENGDKGNEILHIKLKANKSVRQTIEVDPYVVYDVRLDAPDGYWVEKSDLTLNPYALWRKDGEPFYYLSSAFSSTQYATIAGSLNKASEEELKRPTLFTVDVPSVDIDWAGVESEPDEHIEDTNYVFCEIPSTPLQGRPFRISVRNEKGRLAKGPVKLIWNDPSLKVYRDDASQVANGAEFELPNGTMTLHAVPSSETGPFVITLLGPPGETGRSADWIKGRMNPRLITETIAPMPADRTRKIVGIGEEVRLCVAGYSGDVSWEDSLNTFQSKVAKELVWRAPETDCTVTITASYARRQEIVQFQVIRPTELHFQYEGLSRTYPTFCIPPRFNFYSFCYESYVYVAPDTVNFHNVRLSESFSLPLDVEGSYNGVAKPHSANRGHMMTMIVVPGFGTRMKIPDNVGGYSPSMPFSDGRYRWSIDWSYCVEDSATTNFLETIRQTFDFTAFSQERGRLTISKKDSCAWIEGESSEIHSGSPE